MPKDILPFKVNASISDIKVFPGKKGNLNSLYEIDKLLPGLFAIGYGPDDAVYNKHAELREKIARGNTVMYFNDMENVSQSQQPRIRTRSRMISSSNLCRRKVGTTTSSSP